MDAGDQALDSFIEDALRATEGWQRGFKEGWRQGFRMAGALGMVVFVVTLLVLTAGCGLTPEGTLVRSTVETEGAKVYDEGLANSLWFICNAASVGSIRRYIGTDTAKADAWVVLCTDSSQAIARGLANARPKP